MSDQESLALLALEASERDAELRRRFAGLNTEDLARIHAIRPEVVDHIDEHAAAFFRHLSAVEEAHELLGRPDLLQEARRLKVEHLAAMASGDYGPEYVKQRLRLGMLYSRAKLDPRIFFGAFQAMVASISGRVAAHFQHDAVSVVEHMASLNKVVCLDMSLILNQMIAERELTILRQQEAIRELSTPVLQLRERLLILPIIGLLDSARAKQLTESLLQQVREKRARVVVMDVTGVPNVDSQVANHLIRSVAAARLMGAQVIVTGLSAEVAQSLVTLGVDLSMLNTVGDLQGGLEEAERILGYETRRVTAARANS
jgi:rsbT co-antagonist protein RsbR